MTNISVYAIGHYYSGRRSLTLFHLMDILFPLWWSTHMPRVACSVACPWKW